MKKNVFVCLLMLILLMQMLPSHALANETALKPITIEDYSYAEVTVIGTLNLRKSANPSSKIVTRIPNKEIVLVYGEEDEWSHVSYDGSDGYVMSKYLNVFDTIPFSALFEGDSSKEVLKIKQRLQQLGYFRSGAESLNALYTPTLTKRIKIFQEQNNLLADGILSPQLQAFIHWGPVKKNRSVLPPAPYYVSARTNSSTWSSGGPQVSVDPVAMQEAIGDTTVEVALGQAGKGGANIVAAAFVGDDIVFTLDDGSSVVLANAKNELRGDAGPQGEVGPAGPQGETGEIPPHSHTFDFYGTPITVGAGKLTVRKSMTGSYPYEEAELPLSISISNFTVEVGPENEDHMGLPRRTTLLSFTYAITGGVGPYKKDYYVYSSDWSKVVDIFSDSSSDSMTGNINLKLNFETSRDAGLLCLVTDSLGTEVSVRAGGK